MPNSYIDRVGSYMPEEWIVSNEEFLNKYAAGKKGKVYSLKADGTTEIKDINFNIDWIETMTGIKQRYFSPIDMNISKINAKSVENMINGNEAYKNSIEGIINGGVTGPGNFMTFPAHAAMFQLHAGLRNIKWAFDVATPYNSFETANAIAQGLNSHQPGVYIALFSNTREDAVNSHNYQIKIFGKIMGMEIYRDGKPDTGLNNYAHGLKPPENLENTNWEKNDRFIEQDYAHIAQLITDELADSNLEPKDVKGIFVINQTQKNMPLVKTNSYVIKETLGLKDLQWCFDVAAACATTQLAFAIGDGMAPLMSDGGRIVVSVGESLEKITDIYHEGREPSHKDYMDANNVLFGTANASFGIARSYDEKGFVHFDGVNNPFDGKHLWIAKNADGHIYMPAGSWVFKQAVKGLSSRIIEKVKMLEWNNFPMRHHSHNGNGRIYAETGDRVKLAGINGEFVMNIHKIANASGGSCAKMTAEEYYENVKKHMKVTTSALGSGIAETFAAIQF